MSLENPFFRLEENYSLPKFDCGDEDLNEFFHKDAIKQEVDLSRLMHIPKPYPFILKTDLNSWVKMKNSATMNTYLILI